jgi:polyhydroxyalkanoate synthesis regulator phasin
MNDNLTQLLQKGFRVTLGATATLVEAIQDPQRREANLSKLTTELSQLAEEWEVKGATTEREARNFVDTMWSQNNPSSATAPTYATSSPSTPASSATVTPPDVQQDLQELTAQIAAIRAEIERLRAQDNS